MKPTLFIPLFLAAGVCAATWTSFAAAQQPPAKTVPEKKAPARPSTTAPSNVPPAAKALQNKPQYDVYEPSQRLRTRRQECMKGEDSVGAYCVKKCQTGYTMEVRGKQARCRAINPLPPGAIAGAPRKEIGVQPKLPPPAKPEPPKPGA